VFPYVVPDITDTLRNYYHQPAVRARMLEFLGADAAGDFTAEYITADNPRAAERTRDPDQGDGNPGFLARIFHAWHGISARRADTA